LSCVTCANEFQEIAAIGVKHCYELAHYGETASNGSRNDGVNFIKKNHGISKGPACEVIW
jgi:hypothetical protein